ncbi:MAG TPA: fimbrillin family protein [Candidatus Coprenecus stercoravium]|uniref:Fimbrillin family protein n=1 Tax=Candidatus Coprenecus stercoravium TaxID=2840735 RepID=A0A9D2KA26_9BACT|nr:fimbrillin family protein [Candidatus Coprenecus stercoravium]
MRTKQLFSIILLAAAVTACQEGPADQNLPAGELVRISPVITKVTEVNFEDGDRIGLSILKDGTYYAENQPLSFADGEFSGALTWYAEATQASDLIAYYPYSEAGAPETFAVQTDQTSDGYEASDLIAGTKTGVTPSVTAVTMQFKHLLTKILLTIDNQSGSAITSARLSGARLSADVDLANLSVAVNESAAAQDVTMQAVTAGSQYRAIIIPQNTALTLTVTTNTGKNLEQKLAAAELKAGGQYTVEATVIDDELSVAISGEISGWIDEGQIGSEDQPEEEVQFEEYDGYFIYDGVTYPTVTLTNGSVWMAKNLSYLPDGHTPSADGADPDAHVFYPYELVNDGGSPASINASSARALTDAESIEEMGYLYDAYAIFGVKEISQDNIHNFEGAQGICPPGWHVPTRADFFALCGLSNKDDSGEETGNQTDAGALFYNETYKGGKWTLYNEAGWNYGLVGCRQVTGSSDSRIYKYSLTQLWSGNSSMAEHYGKPALNYIMSSTGYQSSVGTLQFFSQMTTFTSVYPEGRVNVAYATLGTATPVRCVKD